MSKVIENYLLKECVGSGQYGKVYKANHMKTDEVFAIKTIKIEKFKMVPKLSEFTQNEIQTLAKINNPNIIKFIEMLRTTNNVYMVYEFCSGGTLEELIKKQKLLAEPEALHIFSQIINACKCLYKENILHRDIKPSNILLHDNVIKVADFGFCKTLMKPQDLTKTMVGSPIYMAPEILKGHNYNIKADIWSMGVVFFEMLFGYCPYEDKTIARLIQQIETKQLKLPKNRNNISKQTEELLLKMLVINPKKRIDWEELLNHPILQQTSVQVVKQPQPVANMNIENPPAVVNPNQFQQHKVIVQRPSLQMPQQQTPQQQIQLQQQQQQIQQQHQPQIIIPVQQLQQLPQISQDDIASPVKSHDSSGYSNDQPAQYQQNQKQQPFGDNRYNTSVNNNNTNNVKKVLIESNQQSTQAFYGNLTQQQMNSQKFNNKKLDPNNKSRELINNAAMQNFQQSNSLKMLIKERNKILYQIRVLHQILENEENDTTQILALLLIKNINIMIEKLRNSLNDKENVFLQQRFEAENFRSSNEFQIIEEILSKELENISQCQSLFKEEIKKVLQQNEKYMFDSSIQQEVEQNQVNQEYFRNIVLNYIEFLHQKMMSYQDLKDDNLNNYHHLLVCGNEILDCLLIEDLFEFSQNENLKLNENLKKQDDKYLQELLSHKLNYVKQKQY